MTIALGVFDVFAYAASGSFYIVLALYLTARLGDIHIGRALASSGSLSLLGIVIASYVAGHLSYPVARFCDRVLPGARDPHEEARKRFLAKHPEAAHRPFVDAPFEILRTGVELHARESLVTAERHLASALMVRGIVPCICAGFVVAFSEVFTSSHPWIAGFCAVILAAVAPIAVHHHRMLRRWSSSRCLEIAYWVHQVDEGITSAAAP